MIEKKLTFSRKSDCSPKSSCGHVEWILTTLPEILREKTKSFCSMSKSNKEEFSKKILEMHFETWNAVLTIPLKIWDKTGKMVRSPKIIKKTYFFSCKKMFFRKVFPSTPRIHFKQHWQNCFAWSRRKKDSMYGGEKKNEISFRTINKFFLKLCLWTHRTLFFIPR